MAGDLNRVLLSGRLGADPQRRPTRTPCVVFRVAANRRDGGREHTEWFRIVAWNTLAEGCMAALHRGARVLVMGRLQTRSWVDPTTRQERSVVEVVASFVLDIANDRSWSDDNVLEPDWEAVASALRAMNADLGTARGVLPAPPMLPEPPGESQFLRHNPAGAERYPAATRRCRAAEQAFYQRWGHLLRSGPRRFGEIHRFLPGVDQPTTAEGWDLLGERMGVAVAQQCPPLPIEDLPSFLTGVVEAA